jgi:hypothetical protein
MYEIALELKSSRTRFDKLSLNVAVGIFLVLISLLAANK